MAAGTFSAGRQFALSGFSAAVAASGRAASAPIHDGGALLDELNQFDIWTRRMNVEAHSSAEWQRWEDAGNALYDKVERLPTTPQNAKIKARAIWSISGGDLDDVNGNESAIDRLVRQLVVGLLGDA